MHLHNQGIWTFIWEPTLVRSPTNATNALTHPLSNIIWKCTWRLMIKIKMRFTNVPSANLQPFIKHLLYHIWRYMPVEKNHSNATCVILHHFSTAIWENIWKDTVLKSQVNAISVIMHPLRKVILESIWKYIPERSPINVRCATMHLSQQETWKHIWKPILERSLINAISATIEVHQLGTWKLISKDVTNQNESRHTRVFPNLPWYNKS